jgi:hypothetical protein
MALDVTGDHATGYRADAVHLALLAVVIACVMAWRWQYDSWLSGLDITTQFLPWFAYIGERLADFDIPAWAPHDSLGYPAAGSPSGGWMNLAVMLSFSTLGIIPAFKVLVLILLVVAGFSAYAFCRTIGLIPGAALFAGVAAAVGPVLYGASVNSHASAATLAFFFPGLLAAERSLRANRMSSRIAWATICGISFIQMYAASAPRFLYGVLFVGGWLAYRLAFTGTPLWRDLLRLRQAVVTLLSIGITTLAFGAAAVLPQLDFLGQSPVSGSDYSNVIGGYYASGTYSLPWLFLQLFPSTSVSRNLSSVGTVVLVLCVMSLFLGRRTFGTPYFAAIAVIFGELVLDRSLFREIFYVLPGFESITHHRPTVPMAFLIAPASILSATAIHQLARSRIRRWQRWSVVATFVSIFVVDAVLDMEDLAFGPYAFWIGLVASGLIAIWLSPLGQRLNREWVARTAMPLAFVALFLIFPTGKAIADTIADPGTWDEAVPGEKSKPVLEQILATEDPGTAAEFLQDQRGARQPFRYAPYSGTADPAQIKSNTAWNAFDPAVVAILANGRASRLGLEQLTGYHPVHLEYYVDYIDVLNGARQDYHYLDLMTPAVSGSQLLDMLNVRYVLVPANLDPQPPIATYADIAYRDDLVIVYENPNAFARAWIVHDVQPAQDGAELELFSSGQVDGHITAFVHGDLPAVGVPAGETTADSAVVLANEPERLVLEVSAAADGLLVVSQPFANGWTAYVDGNRVDILRTNHALQGVPVSAGEHEVVLKYEPEALEIGLWSTGLTSVAIIGIWCWAGLDRWGRRRRGLGA